MATLAAWNLALWIREAQTSLMGKLVGILVLLAVAFGIFYFTTRKMPTTDSGTAPTQAISLTGVRSDLLQIAQAERANIVQNSHCASLEELISSSAFAMPRSGRDGYTYEVQCKGDGGEFSVVARHAPAPADSPIRYPALAIDQAMQVAEVQ